MRTWAPDKTLADLAGVALTQNEADTQPTVEVMPAVLGQPDFITRAKKQQDYVILVVFRQHYTPPADAADARVPNAWVDNLVALVEDVGDKLLKMQLTAQPAGFQVWAWEVETDPLCDGDALLQHGNYFGAIAVTFREERPA